ncbi:MAG TPA: NADP-dependent isocitrate dehydrogenase [Treponemataceae bacterium]|nr:NADP-dependent isocitrate dehydrogenase [Treponemataceae bacterium]
MSDKETIYWSLTDEAPALATRAFLPVVRAFLSKGGIKVKESSISLADRILAVFPDYLTKDQKQEPTLDVLSKKVCEPDFNFIKLPNISASIPQLKAAIAELQSQGYNIPHYPEEQKNSEIQARYDKVKGSAVNPVIRMGNSDRRVPLPVKEYAKKNPLSNGTWNTEVKTQVASMSKGDFYESEQSIVIRKDSSNAKIVLKKADGSIKTIKESIALEKNEIVDAAVMSKKELQTFFKHAMNEAQSENLLLSVHLKATMMKVSDPVIFGETLEVYFAPVFAEFEADFKSVGVDSKNGLGDLYKKIAELSHEKQKAITTAIDACIKAGPGLAMVNSDKGITNFHVPSDIIIDASMPAMIRNSGCMWNKDGKLQETLAVIPDRSYAHVYGASIDYCKKHGAFNSATMGSVANVGLMARKAEEYGSHPTTVIAKENGIMQFVDDAKNVLLEQKVEEGDIFRICRTKDDAITDWIKLAIARSSTSGEPVVFWLDEKRSHDRAIKAKVEAVLGINGALSENAKAQGAPFATQGISFKIMNPVEACNVTMDVISKGNNIIAATGNILRDYLTDLFPIIEVGTSAKMLSFVPLMAGGGLYETGAGGSAPKHVQQFVSENHLRWDSLGEFLALAVSLEQTAKKTEDASVVLHATTLADCLNKATGRYLQEGKGPSRKVGEADNRTAQFYLTMFWAQELACQTKNAKLSAVFAPFAKNLAKNEDAIIQQMLKAQGISVDMGGYYHPDEEKTTKAMRPSALYNSLIESL